MAISKNQLLKGASGKFGSQIVIKQRGGKTILSAYPDMSNRKLSPKQKLVNRVMRLAHFQAQGIMNHEELRNAAQVRLNVTRNKIYTSLVREFFKAKWAEENKTTQQ